MEEYLSIFLNGRGIVAHSPLPPGIFGARDGREALNPVTHVWGDGRESRRPLAEAKKPRGSGLPRRPGRKTGHRSSSISTTSRGPGTRRGSTGGASSSTSSIQLEVRETDWNRFQEKIRKGTQQVYGLGWHADYPDPENFLFLLHGPQARPTAPARTAPTTRAPSSTRSSSA